MSDVLNAAVAALKEKLPDGFDGSVKFEIEGHGSVIVDGSGVHIGDEDTDCTLKASQETFEEMMSGDANPTAAFMTGKLKVDGDMGAAMRLGSVLG
jgi:putative sterol carrier protein